MKWNSVTVFLDFRYRFATVTRNWSILLSDFVNSIKRLFWLFWSNQNGLVSELRWLAFINQWIVGYFINWKWFFRKLILTGCFRKWILTGCLLFLSIIFPNIKVTNQKTNQRAEIQKQKSRFKPLTYTGDQLEPKHVYFYVINLVDSTFVSFVLLVFVLYLYSITHPKKKIILVNYNTTVLIDINMISSNTFLWQQKYFNGSHEVCVQLQTSGMIVIRFLFFRYYSL